MNLNHSTIKECEALFPDEAVVTAVRENNNLDITIGGVAYEDVQIHYHCFPLSESEAHPHDKEEMAKAFSVDDEVLILCDEDGEPIYVVGLKSNPRMCEPVIVLQKLTDSGYDYWYFVVSLGQGYHDNPRVEAPGVPEIITKWWSCSGFDEEQYYTRATPTLDIIDSGACIDICGIIHFNAGDCCGAPQGRADDNDEWYACPCGGEGKDNYIYGAVCQDSIDETEGCNPQPFDFHYPGAKSSVSRTNIAGRNCDEGVSWLVSIGGLEEKIEVGPCDVTSGSEGKTICTVTNSDCGPYQSDKYQCELLDYDNCICTTWYDPLKVDENCFGGPYGTSWIDIGGTKGWRWFVLSQFQGCIDYDKVVGTGNYSTLDASIDTVIEVGEKSTVFEGLWSEYGFSGTAADGSFIHGWGTNCLSCSDGGSLGASDIRSDYTFTEVSYGIAGWSTVVADDGRFAVLIPKLNLTATASSIGGGGATSGSIVATTTMVLRVVDDSDHDYEIADDQNTFYTSSVPISRYYLGIRPNCLIDREIPSDLELRGFHWYQEFDWILAAFVLGDEFHAELLKNEEAGWQEEDMSTFETFVEVNGLEDYTMYLAH